MAVHADARRVDTRLPTQERDRCGTVGGKVLQRRDAPVAGGGTDPAFVEDQSGELVIGFVGRLHSHVGTGCP